MPAAEAAAPPPAASAPAAPPPSAKPEIQVSALPPSSAPPPKKGSAMARMQEEVAKFGKSKEDAPPAVAPKPSEAKAPAEAPAAEAPPAAEPKPGEQTPAATEDPKKKNPWKLLDAERANTKKLQEQIAEANKRAIPETEWKTYQEKMTSVEKRNKELEDEIRYVNYQKSDEFQKKYQEPYNAAWKRAVSELGELQIDDGSGQVRPFKPADLLDLVNLPLQKAREKAVALYGEFADDVMQHRKEVRRLHDEQTAALEDVRKSGESRDKERTEKSQREQAEVVNSIKETWSAENASAQKHEKYGKYFTPREGDQEGNQKLAKGYELADRAFTENPFQPGLTAEQRKAITARHAVVRNRCAAFGRLVYDLDKSTSRIADLEAELAKFKGSEPGAVQPGARPSQPASAQQGSALSRMQAELAKRAVNK